MALSTTCPYCTTMFKVVSDQLKLRKGMVRCGTCQRVFNGLESLRPVAAPPPAVAPTPVPSSLQATLFQAQTDPNPDPNTDLNTAFFLPEYEFDDAKQTPAEAQTHPDVHTLPMFNEAGAVVAPAADTKTRASVKAASADEIDAVDFFAGGTSEQPTLVRSFKRFTPWMGVLLSLLALVQVTVVGRDWISAYFPSTRSVLNDALSPVGLDVRAPRHLEVLSLTSTEVRATAQADQFQLVAVLVNRGAHAVAWPGFELVLNSSQGEVLVKRVLTAQDLLPQELLVGEAFAQGLRANSEREVKLKFSVPNLKFSDYSLSLVYP